jgi:hypothetical protein
MLFFLLDITLCNQLTSPVTSIHQSTVHRLLHVLLLINHPYLPYKGFTAPASLNSPVLAG